MKGNEEILDLVQNISRSLFNSISVAHVVESKDSFTKGIQGADRVLLHVPAAISDHINRMDTAV